MVYDLIKGDEVMPINFHDQHNKQSYTTRVADADWLAWMKKNITIEDVKQAVDIGCGGGIYSKALVDLGIPFVTGVDFSEIMIDGAKVNCSNYEQLEFQVGNALQTGLPSGTFDLVLERALIHHLQDLSDCFKEAFRILNDNGTFIIQDRTPADCLLEGTDTHIRGHIFSAFPHLADIEIKRRHESETVIRELKAAGFSEIEELKLWETRQVHSSKNELLNAIRSRAGRSILHELDDQEIEQLVSSMNDKIDETIIVEKDRWTIWKAVKR